MTAPSSFAFFHSGSEASSASATPLTLLNTIAPGRPRSFIARSSSITDAAGSLSGSVASAVKRPARSRTTRANASLIVARHRDGDVRRFDVRARRRERDHLLVDAMFFEHAFAVVEVAMARHQDVVVARIMQARVASAS